MLKSGKVCYTVHPYAVQCHKCSNCLGRPYFKEKISRENVFDAVIFLRGEFLEIIPRKMWPSGIVADGGKKILDIEKIKPGKVLCTYGDAGWGKIVRHGKYIDEYFDDQLVEASVTLIKIHSPPVLKCLIRDD